MNLAPRAHHEARLRLSILLLSSLFCLGAGATPLLEASLGFGGSPVPGKWAPLWISCGDAPRSSRLLVTRLDAQGTAMGVESFPARAGGKIECPIWMGDGLASIKVALVSGGRSLAEALLDTKDRYFPGNVVLASSLQAKARLAIASSLMPEEPVLAIAASPSELPSSSLAYDGICALVIDESGGGAFSRGGLGLSPAQRKAILDWMSSGGRLVALSGSWDAEERGFATFAELGLEGARAEGGLGYGFGSYRGYSMAEGKAGRMSEPSFWREALAISPYGSSSRIGAAAIARNSESSPGNGIANPSDGLAITVAIGLWLLAMAAGALVGRRRPSSLLLVAALSLVAVFAGGSYIGGAYARGSRVRILALALPDSRTAYATLSARAYEPPEPLSWTKSRSLGLPSITLSGGESGGFGHWDHDSGAASFSLRTGSEKDLELVGAIRQEAWKAMASGCVPVVDGAVGSAPPDVESARPLAFVAGSGEETSWWAKEPRGKWLRSKDPPSWLQGGEAWIRGLRGARSEWPVLAGSCAASPLGLRLEGRLVEELTWAMPLPKGVSR
jgi:hypothetical protein